jgi:hypothetical protein
MTAFADPGVNFALQFKQAPAAGDETEEASEGEQAAATEPAEGVRESGAVIPLDTFRKK